jgi:hypothetical protein
LIFFQPGGALKKFCLTDSSKREEEEEEELQPELF